MHPRPTTAHIAGTAADHMATDQSCGILPVTDGLQNIQQRITEIRQRIYPVAPSGAPATSSTSSTATVGTTTASNSGSFADLLAQATAAGTSATGNHPTLAQLKSHGNGRLPAGALAPLGVGDHRLWGPAAGKFTEMRKAASAAGVNFGINDSYRSYEEQVEMARTKGIYGKGGLAAVPGTSDHGLGLSLDLQLDPSAQQWMNRNAGKYGFVNDVRGEPWHWTYKAA